jgi:hypothetical protein
MSAADEQTHEHSGNRLRFLVAALVALESALLIAGAVVLVVNAVTAEGGNPAATISLAAIALLIGVGLAICVRGVIHGRRWTRGPVLTWQLLQAGVGMPVSASGAWWAGAPLLAVAVVVGVLIAGRQVITETSDRF